MASEEKVILYLKDLMSEEDYKKLLDRANNEAIEQLNLYPEQIKYNSIEEENITITVTLVVSY